MKSDKPYGWLYTKAGIKAALNWSDNTYLERMKDLSKDSLFMDNHKNFSIDSKNRKLPPRLWKDIIFEYCEPKDAVLGIIAKFELTDKKELFLLYNIFDIKVPVPIEEIHAAFGIIKIF